MHAKTLSLGNTICYCRIFDEEALQFDKEMEIAHEKDEETTESTKPLAEIEETASNMGAKRESDEDADAPLPIKVQRTEGRMSRPPNWGKFERVKLLSHILKYMEDPTRVRDRGADLSMFNVLSKVSSHLAEARKLDELTTQYYRYYSIPPKDGVSALTLFVLLGAVIPRTMVGECGTGSGRYSKLMATLRLST